MDKGIEPSKVLSTLALGTYVGALHFITIAQGIALYRLWYNLLDPVGLAIVSVLVVLTVIPLRWTTGDTSRKFVRFTCVEAAKYFPIKLLVEDESSLNEEQPYLFALEPHSSLPLAIPSVFCTWSPLLPKALYGRVHGMASSVCFQTPLIRQLWWALGLRPVSRHVMSKLLKEGKSVVVCPGGVQECLYMENESNSETVYLRKRLGFVRMAMQHGVPLVPVFVFGQTSTYSWWRPGPAALIHWISRQIGAVPMGIWGRWGSPIPHQKPMYVVMGKPIPVPHEEHPSKEQVQEHLTKFILELEALIQRHKKQCGFENLRLTVM